jgi:hypothetical protein
MVVSGLANFGGVTWEHLVTTEALSGIVHIKEESCASFPCSSLRCYVKNLALRE